MHTGSPAGKLLCWHVLLLMLALTAGQARLSVLSRSKTDELILI